VYRPCYLVASWLLDLLPFTEYVDETFRTFHVWETATSEVIRFDRRTDGREMYLAYYCVSLALVALLRGKYTDYVHMVTFHRRRWPRAELTVAGFDRVACELPVSVLWFPVPWGVSGDVAGRRRTTESWVPLESRAGLVVPDVGVIFRPGRGVGKWLEKRPSRCLQSSDASPVFLLLLCHWRRGYVIPGSLHLRAGGTSSRTCKGEDFVRTPTF
jgi:hypothetical protein